MAFALLLIGNYTIRRLSSSLSYHNDLRNQHADYDPELISWHGGCKIIPLGEAKKQIFFGRRMQKKTHLIVAR